LLISNPHLWSQILIGWVRALLPEIHAVRAGSSARARHPESENAHRLQAEFVCGGKRPREFAQKNETIPPLKVIGSDRIVRAFLAPYTARESLDK
jgi:hypothetical protein